MSYEDANKSREGAEAFLEKYVETINQVFVGFLLSNSTMYIIYITLMYNNQHLTMINGQIQPSFISPV